MSKPALFPQRIRLFFHCLFRLHRDWYNSSEGFIVAIGCADCQKTWWGKPFAETVRRGWTTAEDTNG